MRRDFFEWKIFKRRQCWIPIAWKFRLDFRHENLEGWIPELATDAEIFDAFEKAFDYRGDIVITRKDGEKIEGYIFDRKAGKSLAGFDGAALSGDFE